MKALLDSIHIGRPFPRPEPGDQAVHPGSRPPFHLIPTDVEGPSATSVPI